MRKREERAHVVELIEGITQEGKEERKEGENG